MYLRRPAILVAGVAVPLVLGAGAWTRRSDATRVPSTGAGRLPRSTVLQRADGAAIALHPPASEASRVAAAVAARLDSIGRAAPTGASDAVYLRVVRKADVGPGALPGVYRINGLPHPEAVAVLRPFRAKLGEWVGSYLVGWWPAERHRVWNAAYANPDGFIEVTPENADTPVSAHFRLRDFLTHDQPDVWPKYIVLREPLLDKLELVLADLARHGIPAGHAVILSGFRTPAYNLSLGDASGRSRESRHQFGDAADLLIDADHDGRMDDLNGDGRVDARDARVIEAAVNRVERAHPELAGGVGVYSAMGPHGPFAHVDVRGWVARWDGGGRRSWSRAREPVFVRHALVPFGSDVGGRVSVRLGTGQCSAPPEFIALCAR